MDSSQTSHQRTDTEVSFSETITGSPGTSTFIKSPIREQSTGSTETGSDYAEDLSVIPPKHPYRTLVLCFDGTGDQWVLFYIDSDRFISNFSQI